MKILDLWSANEIMNGTESIIFKKTLLKIKCNMTDEEIEEFVFNWEKGHFKKENSSPLIPQK